MPRSDSRLIERQVVDDKQHQRERGGKEQPVAEPMPTGKAAEQQASNQEADHRSGQHQHGAEQVHHRGLEREQADDDQTHRCQG